MLTQYEELFVPLFDERNYTEPPFCSQKTTEQYRSLKYQMVLYSLFNTELSNFKSLSVENGVVRVLAIRINKIMVRSVTELPSPKVTRSDAITRFCVIGLLENQVWLVVKPDLVTWVMEQSIFLCGWPF